MPDRSQTTVAPPQGGRTPQGTYVRRSLNDPPGHDPLGSHDPLGRDPSGHDPLDRVGPPPPAFSERPGVRERARMRRRLRRQKQMREALLLDLGALVYELHRQGRREPDLLQAKAAELTAVDQEVRVLADALDADESIMTLVAAGVAGSCEECGSLLSTDARYCSACGAPVLQTPDGARRSAGPQLRAQPRPPARVASDANPSDWLTQGVSAAPAPEPVAAPAPEPPPRPGPAAEREEPAAESEEPAAESEEPAAESEEPAAEGAGEPELDPAAESEPPPQPAALRAPRAPWLEQAPPPRSSGSEPGESSPQEGPHEAPPGPGGWWVDQAADRARRTREGG